MRTKFPYIVILLVLSCLMIATVFAQSAQEQYNAKVKEAKEVTAQMGKAGISKEEYTTLEAKYKALQAEIQKLGGALQADAEYTKKINDAKLAYNEGNNLSKKGQFQAAVEKYDESAALNDADAQVYYAKGVALMRLRQYDEAMKAYSKSTDTDPSYDSAFSGLGSAYNSLKNYPMAIEAYKKAIELNPSKATTMYNLALVYNKTKDYDNAAQYFRMATQADPEYYKAFNSLGVALMNSGKVEQALNAFQSSLAVKDDYDEAMYRMAEAYNKVGKHEDALNSAKDCLKITKKFTAHASFEAGVAAKALGQSQAAIAYFQEAGKNRQWRKSADYEIESIQKGQ